MDPEVLKKKPLGLLESSGIIVFQGGDDGRGYEVVISIEICVGVKHPGGPTRSRY
jgi:hypothetical protein